MRRGVRTEEVPLLGLIRGVASSARKGEHTYPHECHPLAVTRTHAVAVLETVHQSVSRLSRALQNPLSLELCLRQCVTHTQCKERNLLEMKQ